MTAKECHKNCSDYSCVRAGHCMGIAGFEEEQKLRKKLEKQLKICPCCNGTGKMKERRKN